MEGMPEVWSCKLLSLIWGSSLTILLVRDLGIIKYIKDEDDADLHADLSVYDALG